MNKAEALEKLKKLRAMAERGTPGEAANAKKMIKVFLKKFNLQEEELEDKVQRCWFKCPTSYERKLLLQVISKILDTNDISYWKQRRNFEFELTAAQYIEAKRLYEIYQREWKKVMKTTFNAFVQTNKIFHSSIPSSDDVELSPDELKEMENIISMMAGMDKIEIYKEIES